MRNLVQMLENWLTRMPLVFLTCLLALFDVEALGAEQKVAVAVGKSGEAIVVDATLDVAVSLGTAWDVMTDFDHMTTILGNLTSSKITSCDGHTWIIRQEGVARYGLLSFPFEAEREIRLEPMKRILARNLSGTLKRMDSEARITSLDQGVQIRYHAEIVVDSLLARLFGTPFVRHEVEEQLLEMAKEMTRRHALFESAGRRKTHQVCLPEAGA